MSNAELWDLDTSGGIMEQIQLLVAPPVSADALRRSRRRRERDVYRRPGRAVNHDSCDSCKEGGDLICCDRCPAAFHLLCHDPPLFEEELPTGEWLCHKCKITPQEGKDDDAESTSSKSSSRSIRGKRSAASSDFDGKRSSANTESDGDSEHPLKTLAKAARLMNPVQFDLGKEISCNKPLPGSSKRVYGKPVRHMPKKQAHELDNGLVPLPAKTCFTCNKSCRVAPLIQCDYCPLLFHLDCLNPPLTSLPTGRWMCPNHVEHFLDSCLVKTQSLTERLRLWDRYTGLVNSHTVKVDFLNKVHTKNPMFRYKRKLATRPTISVPAAIKHFYKNPTILLPDPARPVLPINVTTDLGTHGPSLATLEEQEDWLLSVVSMQASIAKYLAQKQLQKTSGTAHKFTDTAPTLSKPTASVAPVVYKDLEVSAAPTLPSLHSDSGQKRTSSSVTSSANTSMEYLNCDNNKQNSILHNGEQKSTSNGTTFQEDKSNLGPNWVTDTSVRSSVSLLPNHITNNVNNSNYLTSTSTMNGVIDMLETQVSNSFDIQKSDSGSSIRSRSNSIDSISLPSTGPFGSQWLGGDNITGDRSNSNTDNCKNIVLSAVNNSGVTKVLPGKSQPAKVVLSTNKTSVLNNNVNINNLGNQSQRICVQPLTEAQTTSLSTGSAHKVITVSATPSGRTVNNITNVNKASNLSNIIGSSSAVANLNTLLQQWIEGNSVDSEFSKIDEQLTYILAWQRLQQLMPSKSPPTPTTPLPTHSSTASSLPSSAGKKGLLSVYLSQQSTTEVRARAVLCPLSGKGQAVPMPYRSMTLGTGAEMDVCLNHFGHCNFVSDHHATIFYDEMSRHFELLNYSEHGTTVDNVLYSCDFSDKPATTPKPSPLVAMVRDIINKSGPNKNGSKNNKLQSGGEEPRRSGEKEKLRMSSRAYEIYSPCSCKASSSSLIAGNGAGWEGTALLHHGSYIKVGCLQFVFSIVDHAPDQPIPPTPDSSLPSSSSSSALTTTRFSSMPLLSTSQYLHNQPSVSLLKSQLKSSALP